MKKYLAFAFFAVAILLSMIREWGAPATCSLSGFTFAPALARTMLGSPPAQMVDYARHSVEGTKPLFALTASPALSVSGQRIPGISRLENFRPF